MNQLIRPAKKALVAKYGNSNVSVTAGRGTATGWVYIRIVSDLEDVRKEAEAIALKAWGALGLKPGTFTSDCGYSGVELSEVLVSVDRSDEYWRNKAVGE